MAKSKETTSKKDKEKKKLKQRQEKHDKMLERKANVKKGKSLEDMMAYIDENGNISDRPPDPRNKRVFTLEDIEAGRIVDEGKEKTGKMRTGTVTFFDDKKGYGFVIDDKTSQRIFVHANNLQTPVKVSDKLSFEVERGNRGLSAVNVKKMT